ncbi:Smr/MutS family protein [Patescibacteria group bacterium]|nr:Smr/MutS family protein [Patescibacteria group bacterium]MBU1721180.1 Smr/MutS family protein [Patescibacteria group bacterium]MBU1900890.1 Smr/MutS family protein [Patescibacteria group bacterium]
MNSIGLELLSHYHDIATIDLHCTSEIGEALDQLDHELYVYVNRKERYCRVIYGIGSGRLRQAVLQLLAKNPMVRQWKEEASGGSCVVEL